MRESAYASAPDVLRHLSFIATFTATSKPNATQVHNHLLAVSDEIDSLLAQADYTTPVGTAATVALNTLRHWTSLGAAMHAAHAMPQGRDSLHAQFLERRFDAILHGLSEGTLALTADAAQETELSLPRYPAGSPSGASPFFTRDQVYDV
jgi:hypothetical protein